MDLLLDTHSFLWFVWGDPKLSLTAKNLTEDKANQKYVSMASVWEIGIKVGIGKLTLAKPFPQFLAERLDGNGFVILPIERAHIAQVVSLPLHHRDPFDRLLIAQSFVEGVAIISADTAFDSYGVHRLW